MLWQLMESPKLHWVKTSYLHCFFLSFFLFFCTFSARSRGRTHWDCWGSLLDSLGCPIDRDPLEERTVWHGCFVRAPATSTAMARWKEEKNVMESKYENPFKTLSRHHNMGVGESDLSQQN